MMKNMKGTADKKNILVMERIGAKKEISADEMMKVAGGGGIIDSVADWLNHQACHLGMHVVNTKSACYYLGNVCYSRYRCELCGKVWYEKQTDGDLLGQSITEQEFYGHWLK